MKNKVSFTTRSGSIYEIDYTRGLLRRVSTSSQSASPARLGKTGEWVPFHTVLSPSATDTTQITVGCPLWIFFEDPKRSDQYDNCVVTSSVVSVD